MWFFPGPDGGLEQRKHRIDQFYRDNAERPIYVDALLAPEERTWGTQYDEFSNPVSQYTRSKTDRDFRVHRVVSDTRWSEIEILWWIGKLRPMAVSNGVPITLRVSLDGASISSVVMDDRQDSWLILAHSMTDLIVIQGAGSLPRNVQLETIPLGSLAPRVI